MDAERLGRSSLVSWGLIADLAATVASTLLLCHACTGTLQASLIRTA